MSDKKGAKFDQIDWANRDQIVTTWPIYIQEQIALSRSKKVSKTVDVEPFHMKAPLSDRYLLKDSHLLLEPGKRYCLIGDAGSGKSTLFEELARGQIKNFPKHLHVHHCKELELSDHAKSVIETVVQAHEFRNILIACEDKLKSLIATSPAPSSIEDLKSNLEFVQMYMTRINASTAYDRASKMLRVLGFDDEGQKKSTNALSGGLRMRVALCAAFFVEADLLLLDEPTNHLDFPSVLWLENRLRGCKSSFIMVCHDRHMLQNVCGAVILLEDQKISYHNMGFAEFEKKREKSQKQRADDIEKFLMKHRNVDFSSPLAKEKAEKKAWMETWHARQVLLAGKFTFPDPEPLKYDDPSVSPADIPLVTVKDVTFTYKVETGIWIFKDPINITVKADTRMGVMGPNGAGKSTFLKLITDKLKATSGDVIRHPTATVAYFAQHHVQDLDLKLTPMEYMIQQFPEVKKTGLLRSHLAKVGIIGDKADSRMQNLSAGLRSCVCFAKITYICPHLLIMDEPTNFLDLESIDSLILATNKYHGALLLVSHNRLFLNKCAKQYLSIVPGRFEVFGDLKNCERATYQFIEEMEAGKKIGAQDLVAKNPSADALNSVRAEAARKKVEAEKAAQDGVLSISSLPSQPFVTKKVESKENPSKEKEEKGKSPDGNLVGRKCTAIWAADGGKYSAVILKVINDEDVQVSYTGYNETAVVKLKDVVFKERASAPAKAVSQASRHSGSHHHGGGHYDNHGYGQQHQQRQGGQRQQRQSRQGGQGYKARGRAGSEKL